MTDEKPLDFQIKRTETVDRSDVVKGKKRNIDRSNGSSGWKWKIRNTGEWKIRNDTRGLVRHFLAHPIKKNTSCRQ